MIMKVRNRFITSTIATGRCPYIKIPSDYLRVETWESGSNILRHFFEDDEIAAMFFRILNSSTPAQQIFGQQDRMSFCYGSTSAVLVHQFWPLGSGPAGP